MQTWIITRNSAGYGELKSVTVRAESLDAARLLIVQKYHLDTGGTEFLFEKHTQARLISEGPAQIVDTSFEPS